MVSLSNQSGTGREMATTKKKGPVKTRAYPSSPATLPSVNSMEVEQQALTQWGYSDQVLATLLSSQKKEST